MGALTPLYTYDFPTSDGSGLAIDQTNPQPSGATFSDFTRNGGLTNTGRADEFESKNWSTSASLDPNVFVAFTITADAGKVLTLQSLVFDTMKNGAGLTNAQVSLFLNGSATAYANFTWTPPNAPIQNYVFDFTDLVDTDNVMTATFKFYGWNAAGPTNAMRFDNVLTNGGTAVFVPEIGTWLAGAFPLLLAGVHLFACVHRKRRTKQAVLN